MALSKENQNAGNNTKKHQNKSKQNWDPWKVFSDVLPWEKWEPEWKCGESLPGQPGRRGRRGRPCDNPFSKQGIVVMLSDLAKKHPSEVKPGDLCGLASRISSCRSGRGLGIDVMSYGLRAALHEYLAYGLDDASGNMAI